MVALYNGFTHDASAHTSYLFIVKDRFLTDRISQISPAQRCSVSFRSSPHRQTLFQESPPQCWSGPPIIHVNQIYSQHATSRSFRFRSELMASEGAL